MTTDSPTPSPIVLIHGLWLTPLSWECWGNASRARATPCSHRPGRDSRERWRRFARTPPGTSGSGSRRSPTTTTGSSAVSAPRPSSWATRSGGLIQPAPAEPRPRRLGRGDQPGADQRRVHPAPRPGQGRVGGAEKPANLHNTSMLTPEQFHYGFTNTLTVEESKPIYDRLAVPPGAGRCSRRHSPTSPPRGEMVNRTTFEPRAAAVPRQRQGPHRAGFHARRLQDPVEDRRAHRAQGVPRPFSLHVLRLHGWEEVADYLLDWTTHHLAAAKQASVETA